MFAEQYHLTTEAVNETVTETATVRVGESLGQVVTSGYCNCPICCGIGAEDQLPVEHIQQPITP